jgi:predicted nucleic-acid-binding protein
MIGLDTNVLVRIFAKDDPAQEKAALNLIDSLPKGQKAIVNIVVVIELIWVLSSKYRFEQEHLVSVLRRLAEHKKLFLPEKEILLEAAHRLREDGGDLPDIIIGLINKAQGATTTYTFDIGASYNDAFTLLEA